MEDLALLLPQGVRHVALAPDRGLPADVVGGDQVEVGLGDVDVVSEIIREALTFRLRMPVRSCSEPRSRSGEPGALLPLMRAQHAVELGVVAPARMKLPIGDVGGRLVRQGAAPRGAHGDRASSWMPVACGRRPRARSPARDEARIRGQLRQRIAHARELAGVAEPVLEAPEDPRDVAYSRQGGVQLREARRLSDHLSHERVAPADLSQVEAGCREPALEEPRARGRGRPVDGRDEGSLATAAGRGEDLQVAQRRRIEEQRPRRAVLLQPPQILRPGAEVVRRVAHQGPRGPQGRMVGLKAETLEVQDADRLGDGAGARAVSKR